MSKQLAWNDELCGVLVTPEAWAGGVVEWIGADDPGHWHAVTGELYRRPGNLHEYFNTPEGGNLAATYTRPIFPPRGWAGKTDAELWAAVFGEGVTHARLYDGSDPNDPGHNVQLHVNMAGGLCVSSYHWNGAFLDRLILCALNCRVIADRLQVAA